VDLVAHQHIGVDAAVMVDRTIAKQTQIQRRISAAEEDWLAVVATLDDVLWVAGCIDTTRARHWRFRKRRGQSPLLRKGI